MSDEPLSEKTVTILEISNQKIKIHISKIELALANALRRVIIAEVPTMAIDIVNVNSYTGIVHDEYVVHRLGLIPLDSTDCDNYNYSRDCSCSSFGNNCTKCCVELNLKAECLTNEPLNITSDMLIPKDVSKSVRPAELKNEYGEKEDPILITKLAKNQVINMTCIARKGIGKEHSKWSPVATIALKPDSEILLNHNILNKLSPSQKLEIVKSCPRQVLRLNSASIMIEIEDLSKFMLCDECVKKADTFSKDKPINVGIRPLEFTFTIESSGSMAASDILLKGLRELKNKIKFLNESLKSLNAGR